MTASTDKIIPRLKTRYREEIVAKLQEQYSYGNQDRIDRQRGMDITVVTTAKTDDEGRQLLKLLGFPFKEN